MFWSADISSLVNSANAYNITIGDFGDRITISVYFPLGLKNSVANPCVFYVQIFFHVLYK